MEIFEKRICIICGKEYTPVSAIQEYCSIKCRKANSYLKWKKKQESLVSSCSDTKKVYKKRTFMDRLTSRIGKESYKEKTVVDEIHYDGIDIKIIKYVKLFYWKAFRGNDILLESEYFDDKESCIKDARLAFK